jgi:hypothetical protein
MQGDQLRFPLHEKARRFGVFDGQSALIVAPTATGKSHIGQQALCRALERGDPGTHAYLVPYRALAEEIYDRFLALQSGRDTRVRILTGDHRDAVRPGDADLLVATYESFAALVRQAGFSPGTVVADEVHLVADDHRGPGVEGLFSQGRPDGRHLPAQEAPGQGPAVPGLEAAGRRVAGSRGAALRLQGRPAAVEASCPAGVRDLAAARRPGPAPHLPPAAPHRGRRRLPVDPGPAPDPAVRPALQPAGDGGLPAPRRTGPGALGGSDPLLTRRRPA